MSAEGPTSNSSPESPPPQPPAQPTGADAAPTASARNSAKPQETPAVGTPSQPAKYASPKPAARSSPQPADFLAATATPRDPDFSTHASTVSANTTIEVRSEIRKRHTLILIALIPAIAVAAIMFGWIPAVNFVITWISAMFAGTLFKKLMHTPHEPSGYRFARALSSVLLIGCLPPNLPWWGALTGGILIDLFSRMVAQFPGWARWFRHISPVVPALALLYLSGPLLMPGVLYQPEKGYPLLMNYPLPLTHMIDPSIDQMIRAPEPATLPAFTWNIHSVMPQKEYLATLRKGELPNVDAVSRPSPMAIVRAHPLMSDPDRRFDAWDGLSGSHTGATLEIHALALLFGILLLCINRIIAWRFVVGALLSAFFFGLIAPSPEPGSVARTAAGIEQILMGGLLLSMYLFAHPVGLKVSNTASWLQGVLLSFLIILFRLQLWKTQVALPDLTLVAILISAMVLPTIESLTKKHLRPTAPKPPPAVPTP